GACGPPDPAPLAFILPAMTPVSTNKGTAPNPKVRRRSLRPGESDLEAVAEARKDLPSGVVMHRNPLGGVDVLGRHLVGQVDALEGQGEGVVDLPGGGEIDVEGVDHAFNVVAVAAGHLGQIAVAMRAGDAG